MAGIIRAIVIGLVLCIPLPRLWSTTRRLTWATAVPLGVLLGAIGLIFLAEVPSRILYWVDSRSGDWAEQYPALSKLGGLGDGIDLLKPRGGAGQGLLADILANTVGFVFFGILLTLAYFWGEKMRKSGRFARRS